MKTHLQQKWYIHRGDGAGPKEAGVAAACNPNIMQSLTLDESEVNCKNCKAILAKTKRVS